MFPTRFCCERRSRTAGVLVTALAAGMLGSPAAGAAPADYDPENPPLVQFEGRLVAEQRERYEAGDPEVVSLVNALINRAERALDVPVQLIKDKPQVPPSGDRQDYMSLSPYWWPDPDSEDGLPYIWRDGEVNPERDEYDLPKLEAIAYAVRDLGPAYYFTGDEKYAEHAAKLMRVFFVDPETRMNPHLTFAQFRPGRTMTNPSGIIETVRFRWTLDGITLLRGSSHWSEADHAAVQQWFRDYVEWLTTSEQGIKEQEAENNHGTWHAAQVVHYALFAGDEDTARQVLETVPARIASQIDPDGYQPHELTRTLSLHYTDFNLRAMVDMARMGERVGVDLFGYETEDGRSILKAVDTMLPYVTGEKQWEHEQIRDVNYGNIAQLLRRTAVGTGDVKYERAIDQLPGGRDNLDTRTRLFDPFVHEQ